MLYMLGNLGVPPKAYLNDVSKAIKKFMVLIKRKLQKGQVCRDLQFRKLQACVHEQLEGDAGKYEDRAAGWEKLLKVSILRVTWYKRCL